MAGIDCHMQEPMTLCQTLLPRGVDGSKGSLLEYEIIVYTSDIRGAGTDADIFLEMWGEKASSSGKPQNKLFELWQSKESQEARALT